MEGEEPVLAVLYLDTLRHPVRHASENERLVLIVLIAHAAVAVAARQLSPCAFCRQSRHKESTAGSVCTTPYIQLHYLSRPSKVITG